MSLGIRRWIEDAAEKSDCQFKKVESTNEKFEFYRATNENYERFLIVWEVSGLIEPAAINQMARDATPEALMCLPAFSKNTDLVLLFKRESLELSKRDEAVLYAIEEDSYSFKKHVLYYTEKEQKEFEDVAEHKGDNWLHNSEGEFKKYAASPFEESAYNLLIRAYIKLPFITVPAAHSALEDIGVITNKYIKDSGEIALSRQVGLYFDGDANFDANESLDELVKELIHERMEAEPNKD